MEDGGHLQEHETVCSRPGTSDLEGAKPRAGGHAESVARFGDLVVISESEGSAMQRHHPALVSEKGPPQFPGRVGSTSPSLVERTNNSDVPQTTRTWQKSRRLTRCPRKGGISLYEKCETPHGVEGGRSPFVQGRQPRAVVITESL